MFGPVRREKKPGVRSSVREHAGELAYAAAASPLARLDLDGRLLDLNPAFAELFAAEPAALLGREFLELLHPEDAAGVRGGGLTSFSGGTVRADLRLMRPDGHVIWTRTAISLARDAKGSPSFLVVSLADVGDLKELLYDSATGLPTRRLFDDRVGMAIRGAERRGEQVTVAIIRLEAADASAGRLIARRTDAALDWLAASIGAYVRETDTVARLGLLEIGLVLPGVSPAEAADVVGRAGMPGSHQVDLGGRGGAFLTSCGFAGFPKDGTEVAALVAAAAPPPPAAITQPGLAAFSISAEDAGAEGAGDAEPDEFDLRVRALEPVPLFFSVSHQVLHRIARYTGRELAAPGEHVIVDEAAASLRVVEDGLFEVLASDRDDTPVLTLSPGDFLVTDRAVGEGPLGLRLRAVAESRMLVLGEQAIEQVAPEGSRLRGALRNAAGQRNRQIRRLAERADTAARRPATVTALYSTKGGSGRTTLATNLAAEIGRRHPGEVLVIDLSLPYNHVALLANLVPTTCIARLAGAPAESLGYLLRSALLGHEDGFMVLPAALRPEEAELIKADLVRRVIDIMAPQFRHVIIDLGVALSDEALAAIERSDRLILVATPELTSMHDTRYVMELATDVLQVPSGSVDVVLNHRTPHSTMSRRDVESILGRPVTAEFRYLGDRAENAGLAGRLLLRSATTSPFARAITDLADRLERTQPRGAAAV